MDWASKLRATLRPSPPPDGVFPDPPAGCAAAAAVVLPQNTFEAGMLSIPSEAWLLVFEWLRDREVLLCGRLCVYMRKLMLIDHVWRVKLSMFEHEFAESQGYPCCAVPPLPASASRSTMPTTMAQRIGGIAGRKIERYFVTTHFHARDAMRRWNLKEYCEGSDSSALRGASRLMDALPSSSQNSVAPGLPGSSSGTLQLEGVTLCMLNRGAKEFVSPVAMASFFDAVASDTTSKSELALVPITDAEDPVWVCRLATALSPSHVRGLQRLLGRHPTLVEVFQCEADALAEYAGATAMLQAAIVEPRWTRFFSGPELCARGAIGIVVVDPMRCVLLHFRGPA